MVDAARPSRDAADTSGSDPIRVAIAGEGPAARFIQASLPATWSCRPLSECDGRWGVHLWIEAGGDARHAQLGALRSISALAADGDVIISTSPILSIGEIGQSVTNARRVVRLVVCWVEAAGWCEVVAGEQTLPAALSAAERVAAAAGWRVFREFDAGPSALTRLFGSIVLAAWNAAMRSGRPGEVDELARQAGLPWSPLRELDRFGVGRAAAIFDRGPQVAGIESVFRSEGSPAPSLGFASKCGTDLIAPADAIGYFIARAAEACLSMRREGLVREARLLRRILAASCGSRFARRVLSGPEARYPDAAGSSSQGAEPSLPDPLT